MNKKRVNTSDLIEKKSKSEQQLDIDDLDLDLGAAMTSSVDAKVSRDNGLEDVPSMAVVSPYHLTNYPTAFKVRFKNLKKAGAARGSHSVFVQDAVEKALRALEKEYNIQY